MTNFWQTQARVPDPKGRKAGFSFGSFKTNELCLLSGSSSAGPEAEKNNQKRPIITS